MKKLFKKWWFWVIVAVCGVLIISMMGSDDSSSESTEESDMSVTSTVTTSTTQPPQTGMEDYKLSCEVYTYDSLARNPDVYKNKQIKLTGEVIQVMEDGKNITLLVNIPSGGFGLGSCDYTVYVTYTLKEGEGRILEDDLIAIYGSYEGLYTYTTVLGAETTVPCVTGKYIEPFSYYDYVHQAS